MSNPCPAKRFRALTCRTARSSKIFVNRSEAAQPSGYDSPEHRLLMAKAEPIQLLLLDVDGVLTDGSLIYTENGSLKAKAFNTQDGLGIRLRAEGSASRWA
jgi:hypothetical protein